MNAELETMAREHFNEPVLLIFEVGRLVGYAEDDDDCYLIIDYPQWPEAKRTWHTCVGGYIFLDRLKGQDEVKKTDGTMWDDFSNLDNMLKLNNAPRVPEFVLIDKSTRTDETQALPDISDEVAL